MTVQERVGKLDWLGLLWLGLLAGVAYTALATLVQVGTAPGAGFTVRVPLEQAGGLAGPGSLPEGVTVDASARVAARVGDPTAAQTALHLAASLPTTCVVVAMLALLARIVGRARRGDPFTAGTVRRLRLLGLTVLAGGAAADVVEELAHRALLAPIVDGPVGGFVWSGWWLTGFAFLAVAEVVNRGVRMRADLEGLV